MDAKQAAHAAMAYATDLMEDAADIRLEEIDRQGTLWKITLSWVRGAPKGLLASGYVNRPREYKVFTISNDDGEVLTMKMRKSD